MSVGPSARLQKPCASSSGAAIGLVSDGWGGVLQQGENEYGIYRVALRKHHSAHWRVSLSRQGHQIERRFHDSLYGSSEASLGQARDYRDAVMSALPPTTNHERVVRLRTDNQSGISGVSFVEDQHHVGWIAKLDTSERRRAKRFSVKEYGYEQAKALAIVQRQQWLNEHPVNYVTLAEYAESVALENFGDRLAEATDVLPHSPLSRAEVKAQLAAIDAHFDSLRPARIRVNGRVRTGCHGKGFDLLVSDAGHLAQRKQMRIKMRRQPLETALMKASQKTEATLAEFYNTNVAQWFMSEHGARLFDPAQFEPEIGFSVLFLVPPELAAQN